MKLTRILIHLGCTLALSISFTAGAMAQTPPGPGCSDSQLQGWYGFSGSGIELPGPGAFPAATIGSFYADGNGNITAFSLQEAVNTPPEFMGFFVLTRDPINEGAVSSIDYEIGENCRGAISWVDQTPFEGDVATTLPLVLVSGGGEGWALRTEPGSTFVLSFKRMASAADSLASQIEQLSSDLANTKSLLDKVAIRNSIIP